MAWKGIKHTDVGQELEYTDMDIGSTGHYTYKYQTIEHGNGKHTIRYKADDNGIITIFKDYFTLEK